MVSTLTYGRQLPATGDKGSVFFPALEDNIALDDAHNHDGVTSPLITASAITKASQTILAASWVSLGGGNYRQEVTMPATYTLLGSTLRFEISGGSEDGFIIYPTVEKGTAANKYYVYVNDNTLTLRALYT